MLSNVRHFLIFILLSSAGFAVAYTSNLETTLQNSSSYPLLLNALLAIGLYTAVRGIDLTEAAEL